MVLIGDVWTLDDGGCRSFVRQAATIKSKNEVGSRDGLHPTGDGLYPNRDDLQPTCNGLQPKMEKTLTCQKISSLVQQRSDSLQLLVSRTKSDIQHLLIASCS